MEIRKYDTCHRYNIHAVARSIHISHYDLLLSVYFESVTWDELTVGFEKPPGGSDYANRSVLSYHFYIPPQVVLPNTLGTQHTSYIPCVFSFQLISHFPKDKKILRDCIVQVYSSDIL